MKVLIAERYPIIRYALRQLLLTSDRELDLVEAAAFDEALAQIAEHRDFQLVLIDQSLPGMEFLPGLERFVERLPEAQIVILVDTDNRLQILRAIEIGAIGFIPKWATCGDMARLIELSIEGTGGLPWSLLRHDDPTQPMPRTRGIAETADLFERLTPRQQDVTRLLVEGKTDAEIAQELGMSRQTSRHHVSAIIKAFHVTNRTQAALRLANLWREPHPHNRMP